MAENPVLEADLTLTPSSDSDSAYGDELASYTSSLTSGAINYQWKHGRRYASFRQDTYPMPNDDQEQERLDMFHHYSTLMMDGKYFQAPVPLDQGSRVLDIGTGTGIWAMQVADSYPACQVIGNDLSPIQPQWVPANVSFEVDDIESLWPGRLPFDLIHGRYLVGSIKDWPGLVRQCYENLKPGGWVEFQELDLNHYSEDDSIGPGNHIYEMHQLLIKACEQTGRTARAGKDLKQWVEEAGFSHVQDQIFRVPFGPWPRDRRLKEIGAFHMLQFLEGLEAFSLVLFQRVFGWSYERIQLYLVKVREDARLKKVHMMYNYHVVYGQKPVK